MKAKKLMCRCSTAGFVKLSRKAFKNILKNNYRIIIIKTKQKKKKNINYKININVKTMTSGEHQKSCA